jgi:2-haloalkanoic acid dehalogenase type II
MDLTDFDALSFDCYGTLIDWEAGIVAALRAWAQANGLEMTDEALLLGFAKHEAAAEVARPSARYPDILADAMRGLGAESGAPVTAAEAAAFGASVPDWPAFPDSHEALERLSRRYQLIILSNVDRDSFAASNRRLDVTFTSILTAQDIGSYKPSPRNFEALLAERQRLGIPEGRLLHVAQSLFHDHVPAKAAGLPTVWIDRHRARDGWGATPEPGAPVSPDWTFESMAAFADAVDAERGATMDSDQPDLRILRERAAGGDRDAVDQLIESAAERGDLAELRRLAATGSQDATDQLIETAAELGELDELRRLAAAGNRNAREILEELEAD